MKKFLALIALVLVSSAAVMAEPTPAQTVQGTALSNRILNDYCNG